jgi:eukaryotic-like serine/threonine-protein kinase
MPGPDRPVLPRNPYLNRVMIREVSEFYGRRREVAKIFARIGASRPQSVAIVGERRIGKSSLLNHLCHPEIRRHHLENPDAYTFVLIDLQEQREIGIPAFFETLFQGIELALGRARPPEVPANYEGARQALLQLQEERRKLILLFDEFDAITRNPNFPEEFFAFLRAVANKYDIAYVTTSGRDLQQLCHTDRIADSPFFNIFSNLFLTRFERDEALALIQEPSSKAGIPLTPYASDVLDLAGLFPFFLQIACSAFFEQLAEGGALDLGRARASFQEEAEPHFKYICEHFDDDQRSVLRDLLEGRSVPPSRLYLVAKLKRDGYLLEEGDRQRLFSSAFAEVLQRGRLTHDSQPIPPMPSSGRSQPILEPVFRQAPTSGEAAEPTAESRGASLVGRQIGAYDILSLLGAGGMGQVYRAYDRKLGREIALKVLPPSFVDDPDRLARFEREARVLAALNHPHIAAIYGFEESQGIRGLVLELVDGPTLAELSPRGISTTDALTIARQIAGALEAAHQKGIIHRDLKPANIKLQRARDSAASHRTSAEIFVKVLDFGLAKAFAGDRSSPDQSQTVTMALTVQGLIVGTPAYMSPEQLRGDSLDNRADIWAFGCVLYELLTVRRAFGGASMSDIIAEVLSREPDWQQLPPETPSEIQRMLSRCLQKDPRRRLHDIADARLELDEALAHADQRGSRGSAVLPSLVGRLWRLFTDSGRKG